MQPSGLKGGGRIRVGGGDPAHDPNLRPGSMGEFGQLQRIIIELAGQDRVIRESVAPQANDGSVMIRFLFRFLGLLGLALGFIFLVYDATKSIADQAVVLTRVETAWNLLFARPPEETLQPAIERIFAGWLWDPVIGPLLASPVWIVLAVLGSVLIIAGRKKRPLIGFARR
jgi:hypothetical protein